MEGILCENVVGAIVSDGSNEMSKVGSWFRV